MMVHAGAAYQYLFILQANFMKINLKDCGLGASIRHAFRHVFVSKKLRMSV